MSQQIEIGKLRARTDPKTGLQVLAGKFGFNARLRIEELPEPDERGATHIVSILPPFVPRDDNGDGYQKQGNGSAPTNGQAPRQSPPARQPAPQPRQSPERPAPRPSAATFGFAEEGDADAE